MTFPKLRIAALALLIGASPALAQDKILNVSYDIGRELFEALNPEFQTYWKDKTGRDVTIDQSHGGSSKQARAILGRDARAVGGHGHAVAVLDQPNAEVQVLGIVAAVAILLEYITPDHAGDIAQLPLGAQRCMSRIAQLSNTVVI